MEFEDELQSWHEGEVAGAAFFGELADSARDDGVQRSGACSDLSSRRWRAD